MRRATRRPAMPAISENLDFEPTPSMLAAILGELDELGSSGGGAIEGAARRAALVTYANASKRADGEFPRRWRYDYRTLDFEDIRWASGGARVPALPRHRPVASNDDAAQDAPALAVENAGGLFHLGAIVLEPAVTHGDPRVTITSLARALRDPRTRAGMERTHRRIVAPDIDRFVALSNAFQNCGAFVDIPDGVTLDAPLQIVWSGRPGEASAVFPHTVVRVGRGARATIVERHVGSNASFIAGTVEIDLGDSAQLDYVVVQQADEGARIAIRRGARCGAGARIAWHLAELGGGLVRSVVDAPLASERANVECNALYFARGYGNVDLALGFDHRERPTASRSVVRGVLSGHGRARVHTGARVRSKIGRADVSLADDALVLSREANIIAKPAFEIAEHDVGIRRRTSIGSLDEETLFYVQQRGVPRSTAARMIALAFFEAAIVRFPGEALRDEIRTVLDEHLDTIAETFE